MKKLLLIAAMVAIALGASADGYKIEKVWELANPNAVTGLSRMEIRQGFGMDGKFYVNSKLNKVDTIDGVIITTVPTVYEIDENGLTGTTFSGGANCGITRDEAGNIVVSNATFPGSWVEATIKVIDPVTQEIKEYTIPSECAVVGRCDFLGFAKGNMMEDGEIWITGATQGTGFTHFAVAGGEVDYDNCYYMAGEGVTATTSTVINSYVDLNGEDVLLYVTRNDHPRKITYAENQYESSLVTIPAGKSNTNGMFPFIWDGKELFIYSILDDANQHYMDGFAITESGAEAPIVTVPCATATTNGFQCNWLNAEVDADGVTIYQYFPGDAAGHFTVWRLTKEAETPTVYILGEVNENSWNPTQGVEMEYDAENNVYKANVSFDGRGASGENYFSFSTALAENNDQGGWDYIAPYRFGAVSDGDFWYDDMYDGTPLALTYENYQAFRIMGGNYELILNYAEMKVTIHHWAVGDVNHDYTVDVSDVTMLISSVLGTAPEGFYETEANVDGDEAATIDVSDVTALISLVLGS